MTFTVNDKDIWERCQSKNEVERAEAKNKIDKKKIELKKSVSENPIVKLDSELDSAINIVKNLIKNLNVYLTVTLDDETLIGFHWSEEELRFKPNFATLGITVK